MAKQNSNKSHYDPTRDTIGKIYRDLQTNNKEDHILVGDMSNEIMKDLKTDIEEGLADCFKHSIDKKDSTPFYFMIHEKKDLQMKSSLLRVRHYFGFRPWPEDDTTVFYGVPKTKCIYFCWCLPHSSEMDNVLMNPEKFDLLMVIQVRAWKEFNLRPFGFYPHPNEGWLPNPHHKYQKIGEYNDGPQSKPESGSKRIIQE